MEAGSNGEEPTSWEELYNINLVPSELFVKFRKEIEGYRVGVNLEVVFLLLPLILYADGINWFRLVLGLKSSMECL